jgi:cell division protein FtsB
MASHSLPIPVPQVRDRAQASAAKRMFPLRTATAVFVTLLILLLWLQFGLSLQITATERHIQAQRLQLARLRRDNAVIQLKIAEAGSPELLEKRALEQNYRSQQPLYLTLSQSSPERLAGTEPETTLSPASATTMPAVVLTDRTLLQRILGRASAWLQESAP